MDIEQRNALDEQWTVITPRTGWFDIDFLECWKYRDLIGLFVRRNFVTLYKQTILGPLWVVIQPLITTIVFTVVFGTIASIPTDGMPPFIFYLCANTAWGYFANCLNSTANTFVANAPIFGKVYFPRLTIPIAVVITNLISFFVQFVMFLAIAGYFWSHGAAIHPTRWIFFTPVLLIEMAALGLGFGIIISSVTVKYRDLIMLVAFGVQLWMYITPVVYPLSQIPTRWQQLYLLNPMVSVIETFRHAYLGCGAITAEGLISSAVVTLVVLLCGIILFSRAEKNFMDTV